MSVSVTCRMCNTTYNVPATEEQISKWKGGMFIQDAMPNLTDGERELLISGTCESCFDRLFGDE